MSPDDTPSDQNSLVLIQTFLIADIRGYTAFTQLHGDEPAARLAATFADLAQQAISGQGGRLVELRGDEVLAVFGSPRQALRSAVGLLDLVAEHDGEPFEIGVGIDAGEAVPVDDGFRGGALNLAARLCSLAAPGRILTTEVVTHLARKIEGLKYVDQGPVELKGLDSSIRVVEVQRENGELTTTPSRALRRLDPARPDPFSDLLKDLSINFGRQLGDHVQASITEALARRSAHLRSPQPTDLPNFELPVRSRPVSVIQAERVIDRSAPGPVSSPDPASRAKELAVIFAGVILIVAIVAVVVIVIVIRA